MQPEPQSLFQQKFFKEWFYRKLTERQEALPTTVDYPERPLKKGVRRGKPYEWSLTKYAAALCCVFFGTQLPGYKIKLEEIAKFVSRIGKVTHGLLRVWRSEETFKNRIAELRKECAESYYREAYEQENLRLDTRIEYLSQLVTYPTDLLKEIAEFFDRNQGLKKKDDDESGTNLQCTLYKYMSTCFIWAFVIDDYCDMKCMEEKILKLMMDEEATKQQDWKVLTITRFKEVDEIVTSEMRKLADRQNVIPINDLCYAQKFKTDYIAAIQEGVK